MCFEPTAYYSGEFALTLRIGLKSPGQVQLEQIVEFYWVESGQVQIVAAGAEIVVDWIGVTVANRANDCIREAVGKCRVKTLKVGAAFKKVGVQQVHIQGILFDVLPIKPGLPGVFL